MEPYALFVESVDLLGQSLFFGELPLHCLSESVSLLILLLQSPAAAVLGVLGTRKLLPEAADPFCAALYDSVASGDGCIDLLKFSSASYKVLLYAVKIFLFKRLLLQRLLDLRVPFGQDLGLNALLFAELVQLLLQFADSYVHLLFAVRGRSEPLLGFSAVRLQLLLLLLDQFALFCHLFRAAGRLFSLLLLAGDTHSDRILLQKRFLLCLAVFFQLFSQVRPLGFDVFDGLLVLPRLSFRFLNLLLEFRHFTASAQKVAVILVSAAADRAAGHEQFALQRHHAHRMPVLFIHCCRVVKPVDDHDPSQKGSRNRAVPVVAAHKAVRKTDHSRFLQHICISEFLRPSEVIKREESRSSRFFPLEELYHASGSFRVLSHDVLDISSQSHFDRCLVFFVCLEKIRHYADDALFRAAVLHDFPDASAKTLIPLGQVDQGVKTGFLLMVPQLAGAQLLILISQPLLHAGDGCLYLFLPLLERSDGLCDLPELPSKIIYDLTLFSLVGLSLLDAG